jgi:hypothetical protein
MNPDTYPPALFIIVFFSVMFGGMLLVALFMMIREGRGK